jgi:hypothetical protein
VGSSEDHLKVGTGKTESFKCTTHANETLGQVNLVYDGLQSSGTRHLGLNDANPSARRLTASRFFENRPILEGVYSPDYREHFRVENLALIEVVRYLKSS